MSDVQCRPPRMRSPDQPNQEQWILGATAPADGQHAACACDRLAPMRGVYVGLALVAPFWAAVGAVIWRCVA